MKKVFVVVAALMILPAMLFAQVGVGPAMFLKSPVLLGQSIDRDEANVNQFSFGGDVRYRLGWFQAEALGFFSAGDVNSLSLFLDAGIALDVAIFTLSLGAGPNFTKNFDGSRSEQAGLNAKTGVDVRLGPVSVGMSYIMALNVDDGIDVTTSSGLLGFQLLFWL